MNNLFNNYINGNLKLAKLQARRFTWGQLFREWRDLGHSVAYASTLASWLKGADCWQTLCDIAAKERGAQ